MNTELASKISTLEGRQDTDIEAAEKRMDELRSGLDKAKKEMKDAYEGAIAALGCEISSFFCATEIKKLTSWE